MHLPALLQFLSGLAENNNRPWFLHNKPQYDILKDEFAALVGEVGVRVRKFDKALPPFEPKKSVFRIYRDVRFSKDKSPYKTHMGAVVGTRNMNDKTRPVHYFHIDEKGVLLIASGIYCPPPPVLKSIRDAIVANPAALTRALENAGFKKVFKDIADEERMTRVPKGYAKDHVHAQYLMNRHYFCEATFDLSKKTPKDLAGKIADSLEAAMPMVNWLRSIKT
jgi:uncharacterized protein (TIGR02453 family)